MSNFNDDVPMVIGTPIKRKHKTSTARCWKCQECGLLDDSEASGASVIR